MFIKGHEGVFLATVENIPRPFNGRVVALKNHLSILPPPL